MKRNLKVLGLALVAIFALGAVVAQAASAHEFQAGEYPAEVTGEGHESIQKFTPTTLNESVECETLHADGTATEQSATLEVIPQYGNCHEFAGFKVTVTNNGNTRLNEGEGGTTGACKYVFHGETSANSATTGVEDAPVDIRCEAGKAIEIETFSNAAHTEKVCTVKVGEKHSTTTVNQGLHGVKYNNVQTEGKPEEVTLEAKVHNIKYTTEGGLCFLILPSTGEARYEGKATVRAFKDNGPEQPTGAQVNATVTNP